MTKEVDLRCYTFFHGCMHVPFLSNSAITSTHELKKGGRPADDDRRLRQPNQQRTKGTNGAVVHMLPLTLVLLHA